MLDTKSDQKLPLTRRRKQVVRGHFFLRLAAGRGFPSGRCVQWNTAAGGSYIMKSEAETEEGQERLTAFCWASPNSYLLQRETSYRGSTDSPETVPSGLDPLSFFTACGRAGAVAK